MSVSTPQSSETGCAAKRSRIDSGPERAVSSKVQVPATMRRFRIRPCGMKAVGESGDTGRLI